MDKYNTQEHTDLMYRIAKLTVQKFKLEMIDHWDVGEALQFEFVSTELQKVISEYINIYERRPPFDSIDDALKLIKEVEANDK